MTSVLVTGGSGTLGRALVPLLLAAGHTVRILSRRERAPGEAPGAEWAVATIETEAGLRGALAGMETVVHAASDFRRPEAVDVDGTRRLVAAAREAGVGHVVYISIVGIDRHPLPYYRHKLAAEGLIEAGAVPWTTLRTTQFFDLLDGMIAAAARRPLMLLPTDYQFQPVAVTEVAEALAQIVNGGPGGRVPDLGGPEVRTLGDFARLWLRARGQQRRVFYKPVLGAAASAYRAGYHTAPGRAVGRQRWAEWLAERSAASDQQWQEQ